MLRCALWPPGVRRRGRSPKQRWEVGTKADGDNHENESCVSEKHRDVLLLRAALSAVLISYYHAPTAACIFGRFSCFGRRDSGQSARVSKPVRSSELSKNEKLKINGKIDFEISKF